MQTGDIVKFVIVTNIGDIPVEHNQILFSSLMHEYINIGENFLLIDINNLTYFLMKNDKLYQVHQNDLSGKLFLHGKRVSFTIKSVEQ